MLAVGGLNRFDKNILRFYTRNGTLRYEMELPHQVRDSLDSNDVII